ncbi:MAG: tRNA pseudouridine(55) synthase TruB [Spirochaetes bacterium]|nr:tRNA pseudouridine(55) synthase TruB [Spirochaetota bacterium]
MNGFLVLNKPSGPSSFSAVYRARASLGVTKIGHAGTLDPFAEGLLLIALGSYTRLIPMFDGMPKEYVAVGILGETRDTDEITGEVTATVAIPDIDESRLRDLIRTSFSGTITQTPPQYSARKVGGVRAYKIAREGGTADIKPHTVTIYEHELLRFEPPAFTIRVLSSRGTYIRTIVRDIGTALGCGAYTARLTRTRIGTIDLSHAVSPDAVTPDAVIPFSALFPDIPLTPVTDAVLRKQLMNGNRNLISVVPEGTTYYSEPDGDLIAVTEKSADKIRFVFVSSGER